MRCRVLLVAVLACSCIPVQTRGGDDAATRALIAANLRAEAAREALDGSEVSGRIRAVVAEIGAYADASATLRFDTPPSSE